MNAILAIAGVVLKEMIRRKDVYVLLFLTGLVSLGAAAVNVFDDPAVVGHIKEICLLLIWISSLVIAISTAARQLPQEKEQRTIYPLLAKPVTRAQVVLGKFAGCWMAAGLSLVAFYGFFALLALSKSGEFEAATFVQAVWLHWMALGIVTAMALLGSVVFAAPSSNATICFTAVTAILLLGRHLGKVATQLAEPMDRIVYFAYFIIPHLEWYDVRNLLVHHQPAIDWLPWLLATPYAIGYIALFLLLAWLAFRKLPLD
jgi:Cu-processing system permease protein